MTERAKVRRPNGRLYRRSILLDKSKYRDLGAFTDSKQCVYYALDGFVSLRKNRVSENSSSEGKRVGSLFRWLLFIYAFVLGIYLGGAIFETIVIVPMWSASAAAARYFNQNPLSAFNTGNFFFIIAPLSTLLAIVTLIAGWRAARPVRFWLRLAIIPFLIIFLATAFYFVPEQVAIKGAAAQNLSDTELTVRANRWVMLNWIRFLLAFPILGATLHALGLAYRQSAKTND